MPDLLKNVYNKNFFENFSKALQKLVPRFDAASFMVDIFDDEWENRALKQRMRHTTIQLKNHLGHDFRSNVEVITGLIPMLTQNGTQTDTLGYIFLPDFIEVYGQNDYETSMKAMETLTQFVSCEFAIRPFLLQNQEQTLQDMLRWSRHKNEHVRRLSTEGCRPRLPWAMAIPGLKQNPAPILPILRNLKNDSSEYVRRSVANNLNDISKDHPNLVFQLAREWKGTSKETDGILKHACRTLLKQGNREVMELFGFGDIENIKVANFRVLVPKVSFGDFLEFSFNLENANTSTLKIRLEYGIYYQKANGSLSKKVFKISEKEYPGNSKTEVTRKQSFKPITTRKYHPGLHQVSLIVNGVEIAKEDFELTGQS